MPWASRKIDVSNFRLVKFSSGKVIRKRALFPVRPGDWLHKTLFKNLPPVLETDVSLHNGIQFRAPLKSLNTIVLWCARSFRGGPLCRGTPVPRTARRPIDVVFSIWVNRSPPFFHFFTFFSLLFTFFSLLSAFSFSLPFFPFLYCSSFPYLLFPPRH